MKGSHEVTLKVLTEETRAEEEAVTGEGAVAALGQRGASVTLRYIYIYIYTVFL